MASEEPKDVNIYFVKGYTKCHVILLALDKRMQSEKMTEQMWEPK